MTSLPAQDVIQVTPERQVSALKQAAWHELSHGAGKALKSFSNTAPA
jgi:hypothetical protein